MSEIVSLQLEIERCGEFQIRLLHLVKINLLYQIGVGYDLPGINYIYKRFHNGNLSNTAHIKTIDIIPPVDFLVLVLTVFNGADIQSSTIWEHHSIGLQKLVSSIQDCIQHGLVEQTISHPFGNDDVNLERKMDFIYILHFK